MLGLSHVVRRDGLVDRAFIDARTEGYDALEELLEAYAPDAVAEITGVAAGRPRGGRAHLRGGRRTPAILWGLGVTEHQYGSEVVQLICNLALMTGKIGRAGLGAAAAARPEQRPGLLRHGRAPGHLHRLPPRRRRGRRAHLRGGAGASPLSREIGYKIPRCSTPPSTGSLKAMWIFGEDVAQTDPNTAHVVKALESLEFLVCQDIFETETTTFADVILPASAFLEKAGTFTNAERRFQLVAPAIDPPGSAKTDFEILTTISQALGHDMGWETPSDAMDEIARADARVRGRQPRADRPPRPAVAGRRRRHRLADPLRAASSRCPAGARASRRCPTRRPATPPTTSSRSS